MAATLTIEVVTPERYVLSEEANSVVIPGELGEFEVLPDHLPMLAAIKEGTLLLRTGDEEVAYFVGRGFVEVLPTGIIILAERSEGETEIDIERARAAEKRAQDRLADLGHESSEVSFVMHEALERARSRIAAWKHGQHD